MKTYKNILISSFCALMIGATMISCQDTEYPTPSPTSTASALSAKVMFINAAPSTTLNFFLNNIQSGTGVTVGGNTNYFSVPVGPLQLKAKAASGTIGGVLGSADILFRAGATNNTNFSAVTNTSYTFIVTDSLTRPKATTVGATDPGGPRFLNITDVLTAPASGQANVRFINLSPDVATVSVRLLPAASSTVATSLTSRAYRALTSSGAFSGVPTGSYTVQVYSGTTVPTSTTAATIASAMNVSLDNGKIYTIISRGLNRDKTLAVSVYPHN